MYPLEANSVNLPVVSLLHEKLHLSSHQVDNQKIWIIKFLNSVPHSIIVFKKQLKYDRTGATILIWVEH